MLHNASHPWPAAACPAAAHHCTKADWILFKACKAHHRTCLQGAAPLCWFLICIQNLILHHNVHANLFAMSAQHRHRFLPKVAHSMCTANGTACQLVHWNCEVSQLRCHHQGLSPYLTFLHCWECQGVADAIGLMRLALQLSHWFEHFKPSASERCTSHAGVPDSDVARNMPLAHFVSTHASCLPSSFVWRDDGSIAHHVSFNGSAPKKPGALRRDYADFILLSSNFKHFIEGLKLVNETTLWKMKWTPSDSEKVIHASFHGAALTTVLAVTRSGMTRSPGICRNKS